MKGVFILVNENIKKLREDILKLSQDAFANELGLQRNTISLIENKRRNPSERTINDICSKFKVNKLWLINGIGDPLMQMTEEEEFAYLLGTLAAENDTKTKELVKAILTLKREEDWDLVINLVKRLADKSER